jgi:hypothetical protein
MQEPFPSWLGFAFARIFAEATASLGFATAFLELHEGGQEEGSQEVAYPTRRDGK